MVSRNVHSSKQKTHNDAIARPSDEMVPYSAFHACGKPNCQRSYSSRFRRDAHSGNYRNFAVTLSTVCRGKQTASVGEPGKQHAIWIFFCGLTHELFIYLFFFLNTWSSMRAAVNRRQHETCTTPSSLKTTLCMYVSPNFRWSVPKKRKWWRLLGRQDGNVRAVVIMNYAYWPHTDFCLIAFILFNFCYNYFSWVILIYFTF